MRIKSKIIYCLLILVMLGETQLGFSQQRFPKPEFETEYTQPSLLTPFPRAEWMEMLDVFILIVSLSLITWFILKKRSRKGVFWMSIFSIVYFGFIRQGCVCSVGSIQNVTLALFDNTYSIPLTVIAFFIIPLVYTLFFGRTFCAGICPLGALQDLFVLKPLSLPEWINKALGLFPFIYLGLAVLYAATATDFVICRYDPFIGIFRMNGNMFMYLIGGIFLLSGIFIARPYCRFFCPYGVLLNWVSRFSGRHMKITPSECIQCKLCENACPFDAIDKPVSVNVLKNRIGSVRRMSVLIMIIPLLMLLGGWVGSRFHENLAMVHPKIKLAHHLLNSSSGMTEKTEVEIAAFRSSGQAEEALFLEATAILDKFYKGSWILGAFLGLVIGMTLASLTRLKKRFDYEANKGSCLSCARCMEFCPVIPGMEEELKKKYSE